MHRSGSEHITGHTSVSSTSGRPPPCLTNDWVPGAVIGNGHPL